MQNLEILALAGLRIDGRKANEIRHLDHRIGVTPGVDGSAYLEHGLNKVLVAVEGPQEPRKRSSETSSEQCSVVCRISEAPFAGSERKLRKAGDRRLFEIEQMIKTVAEEIIMTDLYPKSEIVITVHVLEADGSVTCAVMNAMCLALMHAGISMSDMITACTVGYVKKELCLDLSQIEIGMGGAYMPIVMKARSEEVIYMQLDSRLSIDLLQGALNKSVEGCRCMKVYLENAIKSHLKSQIEKIT